MYGTYCIDKYESLILTRIQYIAISGRMTYVPERFHAASFISYHFAPSCFSPSGGFGELSSTVRSSLLTEVLEAASRGAPS
jgi:hypothetical protein